MAGRLQTVLLLPGLDGPDGGCVVVLAVGEAKSRLHARDEIAVVTVFQDDEIVEAEGEQHIRADLARYFGVVGFLPRLDGGDRRWSEFAIRRHAECGLDLPDLFECVAFGKCSHRSTPFVLRSLVASLCRARRRKSNGVCQPR